MRASCEQAVRQDAVQARSRAAAAADRYSLLSQGSHQPTRGDVAELQALLNELRSLPPLQLPAERQQPASVPHGTLPDPDVQLSGAERTGAARPRSERAT